MTQVLPPAARPLASAFAAVAFVVGVAACSLNTAPAPALTADEWAWCQGHWREGLDSSQRDEPNGSTWYFTHMGTPGDPDTIRVCRAARAKP